MGQSNSPAASADPLAQRQNARREASNRKSGQENSGCRWQNLVDPDGQVDRDGVDATSQLPRVAASTYLYPQEQWQEASVRNSPYALQSDAGVMEARSGTRFGELGGSKLLWISARTLDRRCYRLLFHHTGKTQFASVGS